MSLLRRTLFAAAALAALPALADPVCRSGAVFKADGSTPDYSVQLWFPDAADRQSGILHFGSPKNCTLKASSKGVEGFFGLTAPNGGVCLKELVDKTLKVTSQTFSIDDADPKIVGSFTREDKKDQKSCLI
jgi:hypothetical protein